MPSMVTLMHVTDGVKRQAERDLIRETANGCIADLQWKRQYKRYTIVLSGRNDSCPSAKADNYLQFSATIRYKISQLYQR